MVRQMRVRCDEMLLTYEMVSAGMVSGTWRGPVWTASGTGDPHLQNHHGERFDLMRPCQFVLTDVPRGKRVEDALLVVEADARRLGGQCADMYFRMLNLTGAWADKNRGVGGRRFACRHLTGASAGAGSHVVT